MEQVLPSLLLLTGSRVLGSSPGGLLRSSPRVCISKATVTMHVPCHGLGLTSRQVSHPCPLVCYRVRLLSHLWETLNLTSVFPAVKPCSCPSYKEVRILTLQLHLPPYELETALMVTHVPSTAT